MHNKVSISEIFQSIQGEGPFVGFDQLFIRFTKCNLHCKYCDTDFISNIKEYSIEQLSEIVNKYSQNIHSISLTGGEPLLETEFLKNFLPLQHNKIYLETNGTLYNHLEEIINYIDFISMDIKLPSSSKQKDLFLEHQKFINIAVKYNKEIFLKIVFDENITEDEIEKCINLAKNNNILIVLQPKMNKKQLNISSEIIKSVFYKFNYKYKNIRLIPQVHKFINVE